MKIEIFGDKACPRCEAAKKKVEFFLEKWGFDARVPVTFVDMDTVDGRAEGAFRDVAEVPTTIVSNAGTEIGRWTGEVPDSNELRRALGVAT